MAEDFEAVPGPEWREMRGRVSTVRDLVLILLSVVVLLVVVLARKGVLDFGDLLRFAPGHAHE